MIKQPGSRKIQVLRPKLAKNSLPPIQPHGSGYKLQFSHPAMVADLLNGWTRRSNRAYGGRLQLGYERYCCRRDCRGLIGGGVGIERGAEYISGTRDGVDPGVETARRGGRHQGRYQKRH